MPFLSIGENPNDIFLELTEENYNSPDYKSFLNHKRFHHSLKGCNIEMKKVKYVRGDIVVNKYCHTHNVMCSKTGWEIGYFMGKKSVKPEPYKCLTCGEIFYPLREAKYCESCRKLIGNLMTQLNQGSFNLEKYPKSMLKLLKAKHQTLADSALASLDTEKRNKNLNIIKEINKYL
jgi:hypothetical protein